MMNVLRHIRESRKVLVREKNGGLEELWGKSLVVRTRVVCRVSERRGKS